MDGTTITGGGFLPDVGPGWHAAAADFNGDGKADILWNHDSGDLPAIWIMDGTTVAGGGFLPNL
jgi:hypothetical protein